MNVVDNRFVETRQAAEMVLGLSERHGTPPIPNNFEVWFCYLTGTHPDVKKEVQEALERSEFVSEDTLQVIYDRYLSAHAVQGELAEISGGLATEIAQVFNNVEIGLKGSNNFANHLRDTIRDLSTSGSKEEVRGIAKHLFKANQAYLTITHEMGEQLERSRYQLTEMRSELETLRKSAYTDHLTQLPNRRYLDEYLAKLVESAAASGRPLCVAMADLDHFKRINDTWGHGAGDNILRRFARMIKQNVKGQDIAARIGGEEFALVLPNTPLAGGMAVCETIRQAFENIEWVTQEADEFIGSLTVSIGVIEMEPGDNPAILLERADKVLYEAKSTGRNMVCSDRGERKAEG